MPGMRTGSWSLCLPQQWSNRAHVLWQEGAGRSSQQAPRELLHLLQRGAGAQAAPQPPMQPEGQEGAGPHSFTCGVRPAAEHPAATSLGF